MDVFQGSQQQGSASFRVSSCWTGHWEKVEYHSSGWLTRGDDYVCSATNLAKVNPQTHQSQPYQGINSHEVLVHPKCSLVIASEDYSRILAWSFQKNCGTEEGLRIALETMYTASLDLTGFNCRFFRVQIVRQGHELPQKVRQSMFDLLDIDCWILRSTAATWAQGTCAGLAARRFETSGHCRYSLGQGGDETDT